MSAARAAFFRQQPFPPVPPPWARPGPSGFGQSPPA
jgi:hypothetical protein